MYYLFFFSCAKIKMMKNYNDSNKNNDIMILFGKSIMGKLEGVKKKIIVLNFDQISQVKMWMR